MKISGNTILITGGATGIGFALAERFLMHDNEVIVCGRRKIKLEQAKRTLPGIHIKRVDVAKEEQRRKLFRWVTSNFGELNILINNAGIQREFDFTSPKIAKPFHAKDDEVAVNLVAPIRLSALFTPYFSRKKRAAIVNISSGLGFVPIAMMPIYCATKAALHSFTLSLRYQLRKTTVRVFEVAPPTTDTELDRSFTRGRENAYRGIAAQEVAQATVEGMQTDNEQITIGQAQGLYLASLRDPIAIFKQLNE